MRALCVFRLGLWGLILVVLAGTSYAADLSIYDVQYTTDASGNSPYYGEIHNVLGGVVTHVWHGFNDRVYLQDPANPTWGAIVVKDGEGGELSNNVNVGDWVSFADIYIDESRGTTFLQYRRSDAPDVGFTVESTGNAVPDALVLTAADIPAPLEYAGDEWYVLNHDAEPYESMMVTLEDVVVTQLGLGKADDNYELSQGSDIAWAADYMNVDAGGLYDPRIATGVELLSITGVVEQYTKTSDGWDYYQLVTRSAADIVPEPGSVAFLAAGIILLVRRWRR
ncbi:MAG: hypothetical protein KJ749_12245 [Planctomycetes bacterium]|nr:hypothetical protein [Planctomycetota bacterium]